MFHSDRQGPWKIMWGQFKKNKMALVGLITFIVILLGVIFVPILSPYHVFDRDIEVRSQPPSAQHWMGTNYRGQDLFVNVMAGGRRSLIFGLSVALIHMLIGTTIGSIAGYFGGKIDFFLMRITEIVHSIPVLPVVMVVYIMLRNHYINDALMMRTMLIFGALTFPSLAILVRGQVLTLKEEEFMNATEILGISRFSRIYKHLIPNLLGVVIVSGTIAMCSGILLEISMTFIGLHGYVNDAFVPPIPTWGNLIPSIRGFNMIRTGYWLWLYPMLTVGITVGSIKLIGEGLRNAFDPHSHGSSAH